MTRRKAAEIGFLDGILGHDETTTSFGYIEHEDGSIPPALIKSYMYGKNLGARLVSGLSPISPFSLISPDKGT